MSKRPSPPAVVLSLAALCSLGSVAVAQNPGGADVWNQGAGSGVVGHRDNTRTYGTVYDPGGTPLANIDIWIVNDNAPAARMRVKSRPNGVFQIRNVGQLYNQDDLYGIVLRLSFEAPGYQKAEYIVPVQKDEIEWLYPVLWPENEEPSQDVRRVMVSGQLTNAKGKKVKGGQVVVTSPDDSSLNVEVAADKSGNFEALIWNAPPRIMVKASAPGQSEQQKGFDLSDAVRADMVSVVDCDLEL